jgi:ubiquinone/menaquinone biosynthesis C-methylase UbiE
MGSVLAQESPDKLAPYYPTPQIVVQKMLELGGLKPGEKMFDLGSGDGRIVIMAAQKFKGDATGIEIDEDLAKQSGARIKKLNLASRARIIRGDLLKQDYSSADLVTVYLLPSTLGLVRPMLESQLKKGARVVAHDFEFIGWTPLKTIDVDDDGEGRSHRLFLYQR